MNQFVMQSDMHNGTIGKETGMSVTDSSLKLHPKPSPEATNASD